MLLNLVVLVLMKCSNSMGNFDHINQQRGQVRSTRENQARNGYVLADEDAFTGTITATSGSGFTWRYSMRSFLDSDWRSTTGLRVFLKTRDDKELFANSWISIDNQDQNIVGFPLPGNHGDFTYLLCAQNTKGEIRKRRIKIKIIQDRNMAMHHIEMKLSSGFRSFVSNPYSRMRFAMVVSAHLRKHGITARMQDIWITRTDSTAQSITWVLSTYNRNSCSNVLTDDLPKILSMGKQPNPELSSKLKPFFILSSVAVVMSEYCPRPTVFIREETSNTDLVVGPILLIIIGMGLSSPIFIAYLIRRGIRKREFRRACSVRHVFTNGNATPIGLDVETASEQSKSDEDRSRKTQYRWSPDLSNRQPVYIPSLPPPRPRKRDAESQCNSEGSLRRPAWHGLPTDQCAEQEGVQIVNIVHSISQSASTLMNFFKSSTDSAERSRPVIRRDDDSFSVKSDGNKLLDTAMQKVSSLINMNNFSAPTLIRVSRLDIDSDSTQTRRSSMDTRNSSFECSVLSSDCPTMSQLSSAVNSFDTEQCVSSASFSLDESTNDDNSCENDGRGEASENRTEEARSKFKISKTKNDEILTLRGGRLSLENSSSLPLRIHSRSTFDASSKTSGITTEMENSPVDFEQEVTDTRSINRIRGSSLRRPLQRMPTLQLTDAETTEAEIYDNERTNTGLLHQWYIDDNSAYMQQNEIRSISPYPSRKHDIDRSRQKDVILKYYYDESPDVPVMV